MITVLMPVFNEGDNIYRNVQTVKSVLDNAGIEHGFLLVDDGSRDRSWAEMNRLADDVPHVTLLRLSRNFGKEAALCAGLEHAEGDAVVVMDSDLQHPPQYIPEMVRLWKEEGYDIIDGVKNSRGKESRASRWFAKLFYGSFRKTAGMDIGMASDFKLLNRAAVDAFKQFRENNTFFRGLSAWEGFNRCSLPFDVAPRAGGESKWTLRSLTRLAIQSLTSFSAAPLFLVFWLGVLTGIAALIMMIQTLVTYFSGHAATGFSTVILLLLLIGSAIMLSMSIVGLYVAKIYEEVKGRPRYLLRQVRRPKKEEDVK